MKRGFYRFLRLCVTTLALIIMIFSASYSIGHTTGFIRHKRLERKISDAVSPRVVTAQSDARADDKSPQTPPSPTQSPSDTRFAAMLDINADFLGMLSIPGLDIGLPFVQRRDNVHYLTHAFDGRKSRYGTIFLDYRNNPRLSDKNNVLYGHNIKGGPMFNNLLAYKKQSTLQNAPIIHTDGIYGNTQWLIFAAYVCEADCGYHNTDLSAQDFEALLKSISKRNILNTGLDVNSSDTLLTLSTCDYSFDNARFVVHARKIRLEELQKIGRLDNEY